MNIHFYFVISIFCNNYDNKGLTSISSYTLDKKSKGLSGIIVNISWQVIIFSYNFHVLKYVKYIRLAKRNK